MENCNDLIIRVSKNDSGKNSHEVLIGLNDESMLEDMEKLAEYINKCLEIYGKEGAELEYAKHIKYADNLLQRPQIIIPK